MFLKNAMNLKRTLNYKDMCKCYEHTYVISHEIGVWIMFGFFVAKILDNTGEKFGNYKKKIATLQLEYLAA